MFDTVSSDSEDKGRFLLELYRKALSLPEKELYEYFLDHAVNVTKSVIGFFHFVSDDQKTIILTTWNREALKNCTANYASHYPIEQAGNWADCVRLKRPIVHNDFAESPNQKGLPEGHVSIERMLSIPIIEDDKVRAVFGVGNKADPYAEDDVVQLDLVANELNKIIKQRRADNELRESKEKYYSLFTNMLDGFAYCKMIFDGEGKPVDFVYLEVNDAFERLTGLKKEAVVGKKVTEAIPGIKEANPELFDIYGRVAHTGKEERFELFFKPLSMWLAISVYSPGRDHFAAVFENISERKKAEQALRENEIKFRTVVDFTYDWEYWIAQDGSLVYVSPSCKRVTGYEADEFIKDPLLLAKIVHPEDKPLVSSHFDLVSSDELPGMDFRIVTLGGEIRWISHVCKAVFDDDGKWLGRRVSNRDITKRKKAEEALWEDEERLKRSQEIAHLGSWELDLLENRLTWSDEVYRIFGLNPQEFGATYEAFLDAVHPNDRKAVDTAYSGSLREGRDSYEIEHRVVRKATGEIRFVHEKCTHVRDGSGRVVRSIGMVHDITESKQMQKKLEEYNKHLEDLVKERTEKLAISAIYARSLIEASVDPLVTISSDGKITDVNEATVQATGCSREELIGSDFSDYFTEPEKAKIGYKRVFTEGVVRDYPLAIRHKSEKNTDVLYNAAVYRNKEGEIQGVFAAARDITELRKAEELARERAKKLKDAERLAAIGATAGMVGHDIRNPLQAITGDVYLAKSDLSTLPETEEKESVKESLDAIEGNVQYINKIVADLQDFARPIQPLAQETDLEALIQDLLLKNDTPKNIKVSTSLKEEVRRIKTDPDLLKRALGNLISNAVQAMPEGGKLTIRAYQENGDAVITVQDTGVGIPETAKPNLFQPLFTTKSKGQGFGLAVVKRIVEALNGTVTLQSEERKGTKFKIRLPPSEK
jgi:PAS domain S-box-containing protein